ncbi:PREDICTED: protein stum-like isoform X2 [Nicrophorus vespilloides]|uniref:Protein stum-like isoform X2 n=1 Tax=Nicrophorus vespilloides TaxID=110193 RepID=A0ABM1NDM0_NICVS|nr:PREDICTED: protein stum-like isoform X2 [Nicrophorus vespilloides]
MRSPDSRSGYRPGRTFEEELNLRYLSPGAFTVLSPEDHGSPPDPPQAPPPYRFSPTQRRRKNQAFSIIAEPLLSPRSRSPSPTSGRVSPFRGRGFNPVGSRHISPAPSPPPEDKRIRNADGSSPRRSQIPQLKKRSNSIILTEDSDSSPVRKPGGSLKTQLSKSLNNIGPRNVSFKPPPSPRRFPTLYNKGQPISRLSPIIGSSPEPSSDSKCQSSPSRIPKCRSTPPSRIQSPTRDLSPNYRRPATRANSRNGSRNASPSPKPPFTPTRIPTKNYKNVQAKVNSYNAKSTKAKVPPKPTDAAKTKTKSGNSNSKLERTDSVNYNNTNNNKSVSKRNSYNSNNNINRTGSSNNNTNKTNNNSNSSGSNSSNNNSNSTKNVAGSAVKRTSSVKNLKREDKDNSNGKAAGNVTESNGKSSTEMETSDGNSAKPMVAKSHSRENVLKKVESAAKLTDMLPSATTMVSTTTTTVTQPLKIELDAPLIMEVETDRPKPKETPMYMDEGRVLSAKSVSSAIERMNDTVLDSQTLLKDHNLSKLSPAANAIISLSGNENATAANNNLRSSDKSALPQVEIVKAANSVGNRDAVHGSAAANHNMNNNNNNNINHKAAEANSAKNNINKLISPDDSFGAKVNSYEKSANDRIKEARTMVAADVKPIRITVQGKPSDIEVQSGNVRFPANVTNGITSGSSVPPQNGNQQPEPSKTKCQMFMEKLACARCKSKTDEINETDDKTKKGCFSCLKKKKKEVEEIIITDTEGTIKKSLTVMDRLKCCRSNKIGDEVTTGCCGRKKRKDSWANRRDSILSEPTPITRRDKCKNFFRAVFCCCGCTCCKRASKVEDDASRRASMLSKKKSLTPTVLPPEEPKSKLDSSLVEYTSTMKAAIPVLPIALAYFCLFFNIFTPGIGTFFSGLFCLCIGIPRFSQRDGARPRFGSFIINTIIGCGQLFTVLFCLVGWGWSIWWGVIMLKVAKKHRKLKKLEKRLEEQQEKTATGNQSRIDVEKGRS